MTQAYPLQWPEGWPRTPPHRRVNTNRFRTTFTKARADLFAELDRLGASGAVVSSWLPLRNDGLPRADAARMKISDPGVAVYFMLRKRPMVLARDAFDAVHDNLRSIGLSIEGLRQMERHGGAHMMERAFEGFTALPPPTGWRDILGNPSTREGAEAAYRRLAKEAHPDAQGGSHDKMAQLNDAITTARRELQ